MKVLSGLFLAFFWCCSLHVLADVDGAAQDNSPAAAESAPVQQPMKIYKYRDKNGVRSYSDQAPVGRRYEVVQLSCFACNLKSRVDWHNTPLQLDAFSYAINSAADRYQVDPALVRAVIHAESAFRPAARSKKGALGLMQLMPATAQDMGVADALAPEQNIRGGVRYLAWLLDQNGGNTLLATAAYNAGPGAVERYNGIPPFEETRTYVKRVKILHERYRNALTKSFRGSSISQATSY